MSCYLKAGFSVSVSGTCDIVTKNRPFRVCSSLGSPQLKESILNQSLGKTLDLLDQKFLTNLNVKAPKLDPVYVQSSFGNGKSQKWWDKSIQPNMVEINSAQELQNSLMNAGDRLVVVDFYSPGCGGCKSLHPKISQMAESNPDAIFLKVNYEQHKAMCYALHIHVLPFFRFYRGAEGKVCSFSCTNATITKFKDALSKHGTDRCSLGSAKGLDEKEILALASIGQLAKDLVPRLNKDAKVEDMVLDETDVSHALNKESNGILMA